MDAGQICEEYRPKVRAYVRGKIQDPHDAQDPAEASVSTWVYAITRNAVTDYFRTPAQHGRP